MMPFKNTANVLSCVLGLKRDIVAISLASTKEAYDQFDVAELKTPLAFCMMVRLATTGHSRKASQKQFRCPGASEVFLFRTPEEGDEFGNRLYSFGLYKNQAIARDVQTSMANIPEPCHGVIVQPLSTCLSSPYTILLFVTAYQAMRLTQAWAYNFGPLQGMSLIGNRGICAECVAAPLSSNKMHFSPLCANTRYAAKWKDHELGVGIPYQRLDEIINGLIQTIPAVEPSNERNAIVNRCKEVDIDLDIPSGKTYFYST